MTAMLPSGLFAPLVVKPIPREQGRPQRRTGGQDIETTGTDRAHQRVPRAHLSRPALPDGRQFGTRAGRRRGACQRQAEIA
jgi:hypothetical protein